MKNRQAKQSSQTKISGIEPTVFWRIAENIPQSLSWVMMALSILIPLSCWFIFSSYSDIDSIFLPSPFDVIKALVKLWQKGFLIKDISASFTRVSIGFFIIYLSGYSSGNYHGFFC